MFNYAVRNLQDAIDKIEKADSDDAFRNAISSIQDYMLKIKMASVYPQKLDSLSFYMKNAFSENDNKIKLEEAKGRVKKFLYSLAEQDENSEILLQILENFYLYLEAMWENTPHQKGGIKKEHLRSLKITNEYDVQFLLYAYLKPLFQNMRKEVSEDTGYENVRVDLKINEDTVIEIKCSRPKMQLKKLLEEIEADMVHYSASNIYFYVYDKEKIIDNPSIFITTYENRIPGKNVKIIIVQPRIL